MYGKFVVKAKVGEALADRPNRRSEFEVKYLSGFVQGRDIHRPVQPISLFPAQIGIFDTDSVIKISDDYRRKDDVYIQISSNKRYFRLHASSMGIWNF